MRVISVVKISQFLVEWKDKYYYRGQIAENIFNEAVNNTIVIIVKWINLELKTKEAPSKSNLAINHKPPRLRDWLC